MDFYLGVICGVVGVYVYEQVKQVKIKKNSPERGRPPKKITVEEEKE